MVSDDGTTQTTNLFGLSLIHQDDGATVRALLADGLGSVRLEMMGDAIDSAATYEPCGRLLARSGPSGTVCGFTGEQHDAATGLVYLRARYYNPALRVFLSVDPWTGSPRRPMSYNKYLYVYANPINLTDPTGLDAWWCEQQSYSGVPSHGIQDAISECRRQHFFGGPDRLPPTIGDILATGDYQGVDAVIRFFATYNGRADHRLEMLLRQTAGRDGIRVPLSIQIQFGVQIPGGPNLCPQFEDQHHYSNPTFQWGGGTSYQMSHFLTAVALAYDTTHTNRRATGVAGARLLFGGRSHSNVEAALRLIVGHEMIGDQRGPRAQYRVVNNQNINDFISAVAYDVAGNYVERDRLLVGILGPEDLENRIGSSLEDLRLSVKGWIFGHHIAQGIIRNSQDAAAWLRDNLVSRRQNRQNVR